LPKILKQTEQLF